MGAPATYKILLSALVIATPLFACGKEDGEGGSGGTALDTHLSCDRQFLFSGPSSSDGGEVPVAHRPAAACCPAERGPAPDGQPYGSDIAMGCRSDSECTAGADGRCLPFEGLVGPGGCDYDACFVDSDCPDGGACICRRSASDSSANYCVAAGNCLVDADCGTGGYCSPSVPSYGPTAYYCHTAADSCLDDTDCPSAGGDTECDLTGACVYDRAAGHWGCVQQNECPP